MIDLSVIITGGVGVITTIVGSWGSWFFARRKYNSEVDNTIIEGMKRSLDFYRTLSDDNKQRLDEITERNEALEEEIKELRMQLFGLMSSICTDLSCELRKMNLSTLNTNKQEKK